MDLPARQILTVSELTGRIKTDLEKNYAEVWVQGQISGFKRSTAGHCYFNLKDAGATLKAVIFRFQALYLAFDPEDGMEVICRGRISVYEPRGDYQIILDQMEPVGVGALQKAFEQLKAKLEKAGLFDPARKRPIPEYPRRAAIITSPTGAVLHDMLRVIRRKAPGLQILIIPSRVQGPGAAEELARALELANRPEIVEPTDRPPLEVIVLARGGGSLEDLWAFNEEVVARAIAASKLPVISAVGHQVDYTIADFVADFRASTPTAAAEKIAAAQAELLARVEEAEIRLQQAVLARLAGLQDRLSWAARALADPRRALEDKLLRLDDLASRLAAAMRSQFRDRAAALHGLTRELRAREPREKLRRDRLSLQSFEAALAVAGHQALTRAAAALEPAAQKLDALSPLRTLARGYGIARRPGTGEVLLAAARLSPGDRLDLRLARGSLDCEVRAVHPDPEEKR